MSAEIIKAIVTAWDEQGLNAKFEAKRSASSAYGTLHDTKARPKTPYPYCTFEQQTGAVQSRSSGSSDRNSRIDEIPVLFTVVSKQKGQAKELADEVMKVFGDDNENEPIKLTVDKGEHIHTQYQYDQFIRLGDEEFSQVILYEFWYDAPVKIRGTS